MYVSCSGNNYVCTQVTEGTIAYIRTGFLGRIRSV
jgi:hypothetical protein